MDSLEGASVALQLNLQRASFRQNVCARWSRYKYLHHEIIMLKCEALFQLWNRIDTFEKSPSMGTWAARWGTWMGTTK